jgi:hypothetical protein
MRYGKRMGATGVGAQGCQVPDTRDWQIDCGCKQQNMEVLL